MFCAATYSLIPPRFTGHWCTLTRVLTFNRESDGIIAQPLGQSGEYTWIPNGDADAMILGLPHTGTFAQQSCARVFGGLIWICGECAAENMPKGCRVLCCLQSGEAFQLFSHGMRDENPGIPSDARSVPEKRIYNEWKLVAVKGQVSRVQS